MQGSQKETCSHPRAFALAVTFAISLFHMLTSLTFFTFLLPFLCFKHFSPLAHIYHTIVFYLLLTFTH